MMGRCHSRYGKTITFCVVLLFLCTAGYTQGVLTGATALLSGDQHCISLPALARWMNADVAVQPDGTMRITCGPRHLQLQPGTILATNDRGMLLLPTCPARYQGIVYVPTRTAVELLGGSVTALPAGMQMHYGSKVALFPPVQPLPGGSGIAGIIADLSDPRVPLDDVQKRDQQMSIVRKSVDAFNKIAAPTKPALRAVSESKALKLLTYLPLVGGVIGLTQSAVGALDDTLTAANKLALFDEQCLVPQRNAVAAALRVRQTPTETTIQNARAAWLQAIPALDKQLAQNTRTQALVTATLISLERLEKKAAVFNKSHYAVVKIPSLQPTIAATKQLGLYLQADFWQRQVLKEYFTKLVGDRL